MKQNTTSLSNFKHLVTLSTSYTESADDKGSTDIVLVREAVQTVRASITPVKGTFFLNGFGMQESRNTPSHYIVIRYNSAIDITGFGWLYEDRPSGKRWYKITAVQEMNERQRFWAIYARLTQKSDIASEPSKADKDGYISLPAGVRL